MPLESESSVLSWESPGILPRPCLGGLSVSLILAQGECWDPEAGPSSGASAGFSRLLRLMQLGGRPRPVGDLHPAFSAPPLQFFSSRFAWLQSLFLSSARLSVFSPLMLTWDDAHWGNQGAQAPWFPSLAAPGLWRRVPCRPQCLYIRAHVCAQLSQLSVARGPHTAILSASSISLICVYGRLGSHTIRGSSCRVPRCSHIIWFPLFPSISSPPSACSTLLITLLLLFLF